MEVEMTNPTSFEASMDQIVSFECFHNVSIAAVATHARLVRQPRPQLGPGPVASDATCLALPLAFKKLIGAKMVDQRAKGLCFNCDEKFVHGNCCKRLFYIKSTKTVTLMRIARTSRSPS